MDKVINVENLLIYKEIVRRLQNQDITFDKKRLLNNPDLCLEITCILDYFENKQLKE